jgi:hypothetical protein
MEPRNKGLKVRWLRCKIRFYMSILKKIDPVIENHPGLARRIMNAIQRGLNRILSQATKKYY